MKNQELFTSFLKSEHPLDLQQIVAQMAERSNVDLSVDHGLEYYGKIRANFAPTLNYRQSKLFTLLDQRLAATEPFRQTAAAETGPLLISGAGPCGLRAAVEAALAGLSVHVVEKRAGDSMIRVNVIKTWTGTVNDLRDFGILCYYPRMQLHDNAKQGTPTVWIQSVLYKTALLLGVRFHFSSVIDQFQVDDRRQLVRAVIRRTAPRSSPAAADAGAVVPDELSFKTSDAQDGRLQAAEDSKRGRIDFVEKADYDESLVVVVGPRQDSQSENSGEDEEQEHEDREPDDKLMLPMGGLILADGERSTLLRRFGFQKKVQRFGPAVGLVINLELCSDDQSTAQLLRVGQHTGGWDKTVLGSLVDQGIALENIEYMRGASEFIVCTVAKKTLVHRAVFREHRKTVRECLQPDNVDIVQLRQLARQISVAVGVAADTPFCQQHGVNLFDFSAKSKCQEPWKSVPHTDDRVLVVPVGDALMEPFWPQGLGVNRGFHSAMDGVWAQYQRMVLQLPINEATNELDCTYKALSGSFFVAGARDLQQQHWTMDPLTRYSVQLIKSLRTAQLYEKGSSIQLPQRFNEFIP